MRKLLITRRVIKTKRSDAAGHLFVTRVTGTQIYLPAAFREKERRIRGNAGVFVPGEQPESNDVIPPMRSASYLVPRISHSAVVKEIGRCVRQRQQSARDCFTVKLDTLRKRNNREMNSNR